MASGEQEKQLKAKALVDKVQLKCREKHGCRTCAHTEAAELIEAMMHEIQRRIDAGTTPSSIWTLRAIHMAVREEVPTYKRGKDAFRDHLTKCLGWTGW